MKKFILLLMFGVCGMMAQAATKYEINVGGVEVTSDNCSNIAPASNNDIESGYAVYNPSTNTLTCYSIKIRRTGNGSYGIHNRKCDYLKIVFRGSCRVATADHAMNLARSTTIALDGGSSVDVFTGGDAHALNLGSYAYYISGSGYLTIDGKNAIHGNGSGSTTVYFQGGEVTAKSKIKANHALESFKAVFYEGADLTIESNGSYTSVNNVAMTFNGRETVLSPAGAYYSNSGVYTEGGSQITSNDIYISDNYVAKLTSEYFPNLNFRLKLRQLFPKGYINSADVNATKSLNVSERSISNLEGLHYFSKLTSLDCSYNILTSLPTLPSTLKELYCQANQLTSLGNLPASIEGINCSSNNFSGSIYITGFKALNAIKINYCPDLYSLYCYDNALTSLLAIGCTSLQTIDCHNNQLAFLGSLPDNVEVLNCSNNKFTTVTFTGFSKLRTLDMSSNTQLTTLNCYGNALTSLSYSGCSALKTIDCANNKFTSLPAVPSSVTSFNCAANQLTSMPTLPSGLQELTCAVNKLTSLSVRGCNALRKLEIYGNQIKSNAMDNLVNGLCTIPAGSTGEFKVLGSSGEGNEITNAQVITARAKRWLPKKFEGGLWNEIPVKGDVNGDGKINVSDVTALVNMILGVIPKDLASGDINGDEKVNVSDVTALVNLILGVQ